MSINCGQYFGFKRTLHNIDIFAVTLAQNLPVFLKLNHNSI